MSFLDVRNVTKRFGQTVALDDFTIALESGEFVSLLGPSGCGKTTVLRIVAGFDHPDRGTVLRDGVSLTDLPPRRRDMGVVFQSYSLFPNMTALENVEFGLKVRRWRPTDRKHKAGHLLELVGLSGASDQYPHQLSGGQQQRVAVARALAVEPQVLLMDEPLSALDNQIRVRLREDLREIKNQLGTTVLYVTHDQEEALSISDRVAVMSRGRTEQIGSPVDIYEKPATPFVAEFVGAMNRIEACVLDGQRGAVQHADGVLALDDARGRQNGNRVLVLIRPESLSVNALHGNRTPADAYRGCIIAQSFLGPVTRLKVKTLELGVVSIDTPSARSRDLHVGMEVAVSFEAQSARILDLTA